MGATQATRAVPAGTGLAEVPERATPAAAVHTAKVAYVTDPDRRSLEHHWRAHARTAIGWSSFRRRSAQASWPEEREKFWETVTAKIVSERATEMAQAQLAELGQLTHVRERLLDLVGTTPPRSLEGVVAALVRLDERVEAKRQAALDRFEPLLQALQQQVPSKSPFTPEEARCVAHALLHLRIDKARQQEDPEHESEDESAPPTI